MFPLWRSEVEPEQMFFFCLSHFAGYEEKNKETIDFGCKIIYLLIYNYEYFFTINQVFFASFLSCGKFFHLLLPVQSQQYLVNR